MYAILTAVLSLAVLLTACNDDDKVARRTVDSPVVTVDLGSDEPDPSSDLPPVPTERYYTIKLKNGITMLVPRSVVESEDELSLRQLTAEELTAELGRTGQTLQYGPDGAEQVLALEGRLGKKADFTIEGLSFILPRSALPANGLPSNALPANALPANGIPSNAIPANALPSSALPASALPASALPASALPASALPSSFFLTAPSDTPIPADKAMFGALNLAHATTSNGFGQRCIPAGLGEDEMTVYCSLRGQFSALAVRLVLVSGQAGQFYQLTLDDVPMVFFPERIDLVTKENRPPVIATPERCELPVGVVSQLPLQASDPDGDYLLAEVEGLPTFAERSRDHLLFSPFDESPGTTLNFELAVRDAGIPQKITQKTVTCTLVPPPDDLVTLSLVTRGGYVNHYQVEAVIEARYPVTEMRLAASADLLGPAAWQPFATSAVVDLGAAPDGPHTVLGEFRFEGGHSVQRRAEVILDTQAPSLDLAAAPAERTRETSALFTYRSDESVLATCRIDDLPFLPCQASQLFPGLGEGEHSFELRLEDPAGNLTSLDPSYRWTVDRTGPASPVVTNPPGTTPFQTAMPTVQLAGVCSPETALLELNGSAAGLDNRCASEQRWAGSAALAPGTNEYELVAYDSLGNASSPVTIVLVLDTSAPTCALVPPASPSLLRTPTLHWNACADHYELQLGSDELFTTVLRTYQPLIGTSFSVPTTEPLPEGELWVRLRGFDLAGNASTWSLQPLTIDLTPPVCSLPPLVSPTNNDRPIFTFNACADLYDVELASDPFFAPASIVHFWADTLSTNLSLENDPLTLDGEYYLRLRGKDLAGNVGAWSQQSFVLQLHGPVCVLDPLPTPSREVLPTFTWNACAAWYQFEVAADADFTTILQYNTLTSTSSPLASPLPRDGTYYARLRGYDNLGNDGTWNTQVYELDRTGPSCALNAPNSPTNVPRPTFSWNACATSYDLTVTTTAGTLIHQFTGLTGTSAVLPVDLSADTSYSVALVGYDGLDNAGPASLRTFLFDSTGPNCFLPTPPARLNDPTPTFSWPICSGAVSYVLELAADPAFTPTLYQYLGPATSTTYLQDLPQDGPYYVRLAGLDSLGNRGTEDVHAFELDRIGPTCTLVPPLSPNAEAQPTFAWNDCGEVSYQLQLLGPTSNLLFDLPGLAGTSYPSGLTLTEEGIYTVRLRGNDGLNNGPWDSRQFSLDLTGPTCALPAQTSPTNEATPIINWTTCSGASEYELEVRLGGTPEHTVSNLTTTTYPLPPLAEGDYTVHLAGVDELGNRGPFAVLPLSIDLTPPTCTVASFATPTRDDTPSFAWNACGVRYELLLLDHLGGEVINEPGLISTSYQVVNSLPDGTYELRMRGFDQAGNPSPWDSVPLEVDTTGPMVAFNVLPSSPGNDQEPVFGWTSVDADVYEITFFGPGGGLLQQESGSPATSYTSPTLTQDGEYRLEITGIDLLGNLGATKTAYYELDRTGPNCLLTQPTTPTNLATPTFIWTTCGDSYDFELTGPGYSHQVFGTAATPYDLPPVNALTVDGSYTARVRGYDQYGNPGEWSSKAFNFDSTGPICILDQPVSPTNNPRPTLTWGTCGAASYKVTVFSDPARQNLLQESPLGLIARTYTLGEDLPDGPAYLRLVGFDSLDNPGLPSERDISVDTNGATNCLLTAYPMGSTNDRTPSFSWENAGAGITYHFFVDNNPDYSSTEYFQQETTLDATIPPGEALALDGTYHVKLTCTDGLNPVDAPEITFTLDTLAPTYLLATLLSPSNDPTPTPAWSGTADFYDLEVRDTLGAIVYSVDGLTGTQHELQSDLPGDGTYTVLLTGRDLAGNVGTPVQQTYQLLSVGPSCVLYSLPSPTADATPDFSWPVCTEAVEYRLSVLDHGGATVLGPQSLTGPATTSYTFLNTLPGDGPYTAVLAGKNALGIWGPDSTISFALDTMGPDCALNPVTPNPGNDNTPSLSWTCTGGASTYDLRATSTPPGNGFSLTGLTGTSHTTVALPDGLYTFELRGVDSLGNPGPWAAQPYTLDTVAPTCSLYDPTPGTRIADATPTLRWTGVAWHYDLVLDDAPDYLSPAFAQYDLTSLTATVGSPLIPDGPWYDRLSCRDEAGNAGQRQSDFVLDTTGPTCGLGSQPTATNDRNPTFTWQPCGGDTVEYLFQVASDSSFTMIVYQQQDAATTATVAPDLADGLYYYRLAGLDDLDNQGPYANRQIRVDTMPPNCTFAAFTSPSTETLPTFSWSGCSDAVSYDVELRNPANTLIKHLDATAATSFMPDSPLTEGVWTVRLRGYDALGNVQLSWNEKPYEVDLTGPTCAMDAPTTPTGDVTPAFTWLACAASYLVEIATDSGFTSVIYTEADADPSSTGLSVNDPGLPGEGTYYLRFAGLDSLGNRGAWDLHQFALQTTGPTCVLDLPLSPFTQEPSLTFTWKSCGADHYQFTLDDEASFTPPHQFDDSSLGGAVTSQNVAVGPDGSYSARLIGYDALGNPGPASTVQVTLDRQAPECVWVATPPDPTTNPEVTYGWNCGESLRSSDCHLTPVGADPLYYHCTSPFTSTPTTPARDYRFHLRTVDQAGNEAVLTHDLTVTSNLAVVDASCDLDRGAGGRPIACTVLIENDGLADYLPGTNCQIRINGELLDDCVLPDVYHGTQVTVTCDEGTIPGWLGEGEYTLQASVNADLSRPETSTADNQSAPRTFTVLDTYIQFYGAEGGQYQATALLQRSDGLLALLGTSNENDPSGDVVLYLLNRDGTLLEEQFYDNGEEQAEALTELYGPTPDLALLSTFGDLSLHINPMEIQLRRVDQSGDPSWSQTNNQSGKQVVGCGVHETDNGTLVVVGAVRETNGTSLFTVLYNSTTGALMSGGTERSVTGGYLSACESTSLHSTDPGTILAVTTNNYSSYQSQAWRIEDNGTSILAPLTISATYPENFKATDGLLFSADYSDMLLTGSWWNSPPTQLWVRRTTSPNGPWEHTYGGTGYDSGVALVHHDPDDPETEVFVVAGTYDRTSGPELGPAGWLLWLDPADGAIRLERTYEQPGKAINSKDLVAYDRGGYLLLGHAKDTTLDYTQIVLIKTDQDGYVEGYNTP